MPAAAAMLLLFLSVSGNADTQGSLDAALEYASLEEDLAKVRMLLDAGANADSHGHGPHDTFPLQNAAYRGDAEMVRLLLKRGANPNRRDDYGWTAFFLAAGHEEFEALDVLIHWKGCRHCLRGTTGETALHLAVLWCRPNAVKYLLEHSRVRKNVKDDDGKTALDHARQRLQYAEPNEKAKWMRIITLLQ